MLLTTISIGLAKSMIGKYNSAEHFLSRIPDRSQQKTIALLLLIENSMRADKRSGAEKYAQKLISRASPETIHEKLREANESGMMWPVSTDLVAPVIAKELQKQSEKIAKTKNVDEG
ncbi:MAG: hypothetical protein K9J85_08155 [Desulfobacteraceae bacterium]|nr:hypothetical protein [Desulfobacteraceae bacterium]